MLSLELADALFRAAGDCHVLLVGDTDQLPPIGAGPRARRSRRERRRAARPPDRDLPAGGALADHPERAPHQRAASCRSSRSTRRARRSAPTPSSTRTSSSSRATGPQSMLEAVLELVCERIPARFGLRPAHRGDDARADAPRARRPDRAERGARAAPQPGRAAGRRRRARACASARASSRRRTTTRLDREVMNGEVAFILDWDEEEGEARLSLDDGEREIVVPVVGARDVRPRLGAHRAPRAGLAVPGRRRAVVDGVLA